MLLAYPRLALRPPIWRMVNCRMAHAIAPAPPPAPKQLHFDEPGFFKYEKDFSRDKRYSNPPKPGDIPSRFLLRRLHHTYELYPLFGLGVFLILVTGLTIYQATHKIELFIDKSTKVHPGDWERVRENYWKKPTLLYDPEGVSHQRLHVMEELEDEMLEAAKKRGTR